MKNLGKILALTIFFVASQQSIEHLDIIDFNVEQTHKGNGFVFELSNNAFEIIPVHKVKETKYFFTYSINVGKGHYQYPDGTILEENTQYELQSLKFLVDYFPESKELHNVTILIKDSSGQTKEVQMNYSIEYAPFTF